MYSSYWEREHWLKEIDFLIIGAGLTGLQTSIELREKEPKAKVVLIDRAAWSQGASTKNAGFACFANIGELMDDLEKSSEHEVMSTVKKRYLGLAKLRERIGDANMDFQQKGSAEIFLNSNKAEMMKAIDSLRGINTIMYDLLGLDQVFNFSSKTQITQAVGAIHNPHEGQLNTGKMYQCLMEIAQNLGVLIFGGLSLSNWQTDNKVKVQFKEGVELECKQLLLCTNAFMAEQLKEDIVPARGQVIVSEQLESLPCRGLHMYDKGYYYWRDIDNRILLGGARNVDIEGEESTQFGQNDKVLDELKRFMKEVIVEKEVKIEYNWSGIMAMGGSKLPIVKKVDNGVYLASRLGGMGVALSSIVAQELVELIRN